MDQTAIFARYGATITRTHDVHIPVANLRPEHLRAVTALESYGVSPAVRGDALRIPCFFRAAAAELLAQ